MTRIESATAEPAAWFKLDQAGAVLSLGGSWTIQQSARLDGELHGLNGGGNGPIAIDASGISRLDSAGAFAMRLCVEEAATNIALYAYVPACEPGTIAAAASNLGAAGVRLTITDHGRPFDVAAARDPGVEHDIQSATIGGRGIRLMREFSDTLQYARIGEQNQLTLTFAVKGSQPEP